MTYILLFVGFIVGLFVSSFGLLQALICIFFGIPTANKLTREGVLVKPNPIARKYLISTVLLLSIFAGVSLLVYLFAPSAMFTGYIIGAGMTLLFGLGQIGGNKNNIDDFLQTNAKYVSTKGRDI